MGRGDLPAADVDADDAGVGVVAPDGTWAEGGGIREDSRWVGRRNTIWCRAKLLSVNCKWAEGPERTKGPG